MGVQWKRKQWRSGVGLERVSQHQRVVDVKRPRAADLTSDERVMTGKKKSAQMTIGRKPHRENEPKLSATPLLELLRAVSGANCRLLSATRNRANCAARAGIQLTTRLAR